MGPVQSLGIKMISFSERLFNTNSEWTIDLGNDMDGSQKRYSE